MKGAATENDCSTLPHKIPRTTPKPVLEAESVPQANPVFDLKALLQATLAKETRAEVDSLFSLSPLSSACPSPATLPTDLDCEETMDLSPLTSPPSSRPSSPTPRVVQTSHGGNSPSSLPDNDLPSLVPVYDSDDSEAESASAAPQSRTKARLKARLRARTHRRRGDKRRQEREHSFSNFPIRPNVQSKRVDQAESVKTEMRTEKASAACGAFVGKNEKGTSKSPAAKVFTLEQLVGENSEYGFTYVSWNGSQVKRITDAEGRVIAILAGHPEDASWASLAQEAADAIESASSNISTSDKEERHRRGAFPALRCGVSHGGGSSRPSNLSNSENNAKILDSLSKLKPFQRLAGFASSAMAAHAPKLYAYYVDSLGKLHSKHPHLRRLFPSSVFAAASYNFGPRTVCYKHKDFANLPFGLCAVTALGSFDPQRGGHLVLWDCHLVVEFPPGSTILLPSAIVAHSNTPVAPHEKRFSFAQYTAGGLFRWVEHGYRLSSKFYASLSNERLEKERQREKRRWEFGLSLFEKI